MWSANMSPCPESASPGDERINQAIAAYLEAVEAGSEPARQNSLARSPALAAGLPPFFTAPDRSAPPAAQVHPAAPPCPAPEATPALQTALPCPAGAAVRYFGDYELLEEIARGGMGVVYK